MHFLRLAQKYGDSVGDLLIKDYIQVTADHNGWDNVTFFDCLNMVTGIGDNNTNSASSEIFADENQPKMDEFGLHDTALGKLNIVFSYGNFPWSPGTVVRYNSVFTFTLAAAMDAFLKEQRRGKCTFMGNG